MRLLLAPLLLLAACDAGPALPTDDTDTEAVDTEPTDTDCPDADGDGASCDDCDDRDPLRRPGAAERCNGVDDDCDGAAPDEVPMGGVYSCTPCDEAGMWTQVQTAAGPEDLERRLDALGSGFITCTYADARAHVFTALDNDEGWVEAVYTGERVFVGQAEPDYDELNLEHTWPGADGGREGIRECDLHHLFPAIADVNNRRANYPFGEVVGEVDWSRGEATLGEDAAGDTVFEPRDSHKGNTARAMLYMAQRHDLTLAPAYATLLRRWHRDDPPDTTEQMRSLSIQARQGNANPFVACPTVADLLVE